MGSSPLTAEAARAAGTLTDGRRTTALTGRAHRVPRVLDSVS